MRVTVEMRIPLLEPLEQWAERQVRERRAAVLQTADGPLILASPEPIFDVHRARISFIREEE